MKDGRLFVFFHVGGTDASGKPMSENRLVERDPEGRHGEPARVKLQKPLRGFFTATPRAGCEPSSALDLLGDVGGTMRYVRLRLE